MIPQITGRVRISEPVTSDEAPLDESCIVCFGPASDRHHIVPRSQAPERIDDISNLVAVCRPCHDNLSGGPWSDVLEDNLYRVTEGLAVIAERPVGLGPTHMVLDTYSIEQLETLAASPSLSTENLIYCDPEGLAWLFDRADKAAGREFLRACMCVARLHELAFPLSGERWVEQAQHLFGRSRTTIYLYAQIWGLYQRAKEEDALSAYLDEMQRIGPGAWNVLVGEVRGEHQIEALGETVALLAEEGHAHPAGVRRRLQAVGLARQPVYIYRCPRCSLSGDLGLFRVRAAETEIEP